MTPQKLLSIIALFLCITIPLSAEYLFLTDGTIIQGRVIRENATSVIFRPNESKKTPCIPTTG